MAKGGGALRSNCVLRYVVAAAECGGFRRAAKARKIQESAISRRIRDLEDEPVMLGRDRAMKRSIIGEISLTGSPVVHRRGTVVAVIEGHFSEVLPNHGA